MMDAPENQQREVLEMLPCVYDRSGLGVCGPTERCTHCQARDEIERLQTLRHDLGLRNQILARDRAAVHRAARRLLAAIDEDDDSVSEYLKAREALRKLVAVS